MNTDIIGRIATASTDVVGLILCYYFFSGFLEKKESNIGKYIRFFILIGVFLLVSNQIVNGQIWLILLAVATYTTIVMFCFEGHMYIKMISGIFFVTFGVICEVITAILISLIIKVNFEDIAESSYLYLLGTFISKLIMLIVIRLVLGYIGRRTNSIIVKYWMILLSIPVICIFVILHTFKQSMQLQEYDIFSLICTIGILYINMITFGLFEGIIRKTEEADKFRYANQQLILQQEHYKSMLVGQENTRGIWHDMKNSLLAIYSCIENKEIEAAKENIRSIQKDLEYSMKEYITGNTVVDAILSEKKGVAKSFGIEMDIDLIILEEISINPMDLCTILGNGLDNAIEACERITVLDIVKRIRLKMRCENNALLIQIINPVNEQTIIKKKGRFISSKEKVDRKVHGYGIYNMERVIKNNKGNIMMEVSRGRFIFEILIPIYNEMT